MAGRVEPGQLAAIPDECEKIAAKPVAAWLDDGQGDGSRQRSVDRVAACLQHRDPGLHGERLRSRDDIAGKDR